jgi:hypothetical protein
VLVQDGSDPTGDILAWPVEMAGLKDAEVAEMDGKLVKQFTRRIQRAGTLALTTDMARQNRSEVARAYLLPGKESTTIMIAHPSDRHGIDQTVYLEIISAVLGLPSPMCAPFVGKQLKHNHTHRGERMLDAYGKVLSSLTLPGNQHGQRATVLERMVVTTLRDAGILAIHQPAGFLSGITQPNLSDQAVSSVNQMYTPDIGFRHPVTGAWHWLEMKNISHSTIANRQTIRADTAPTRNAWVNKREQNVPLAIAKQLRLGEQGIHGTAHGWDGTDAQWEGPVTQAFQQLVADKQFHAIVTGPYGELSTSFHQLIAVATESAVEKHMHDFGSHRGEETVRCMMRERIRTDIVLATVRENARIITQNLRFVEGAGSPELSTAGRDMYTSGGMHHRYDYMECEHESSRQGGFGGRHRGTGR